MLVYFNNLEDILQNLYLGHKSDFRLYLVHLNLINLNENNLINMKIKMLSIYSTKSCWIYVCYDISQYLIDRQDKKPVSRSGKQDKKPVLQQYFKTFYR